MTVTLTLTLTFDLDLDLDLDLELDLIDLNVDFDEGPAAGKWVELRVDNMLSDLRLFFSLNK